MATKSAISVGASPAVTFWFANLHQKRKGKDTTSASTLTVQSCFVQLPSAAICFQTCANSPLSLHVPAVLCFAKWELSVM